MIGRFVPMGLVAAALAIFVASVLIEPFDVLGIVLFFGLIVSFGSVGALLVDRVPGNRIGVMMIAVATLPAAVTACGAYAGLGAAAVPQWPGTGLASALTDALFIYPFVIALIGIPLVFPDGHLPSPRFRWIVWLTIVAMAAATASDLFGPLAGPADLTNPLQLYGLEPVFEILDGVSSLTSVIGFGGAAAAVWVRFRGDDPIVRQQTKWLLAVAAVAAIALPSALIIPIPALADTMFLIGFLAMLGLPVAIGIAILRYRLYDIDRIVSRTIAYVLISSLLVAAYVGLVIVVGGPLGDLTGGESISVALSTLVVAALFQPLRGRVQKIVDRRFDRARIDADRTAAAFSERLRDEVDIETVTSDLRETVHATIRPQRLGLWLREAGR